MRSRRATLFAVTVASGLTSLPTTALGVAIPTLQDDLGASLAQVQWTLSAYSIAYSSLLVVAGRLADIFGRRRLFLAGAAVFSAGCFSAALAQNPGWLIVSLAVIGVGGAMMVPASLSIITNAFAGRGRVRAVAVWGGASGLVSGLGPPIGGILTQEAGWPSIFWVALGIAAIVLAVAFPSVEESSDETASRTIDYAGVLALAGTIVLLSLSLIEAPPSNWTEPLTMVLFGLVAGFAVLLVLVERRSSNPIIELDVLRHRNFVAGVTVKLVVNFVLAGLLFMLPIYLQEILHYSPLQSGLLLLPLSATFLMSLPVGGRLMERYGPRLPLVTGLGLAAISLVFLGHISLATSYANEWPPMLGLGVGVGLVLTPMNLTAINAVPLRQHGAATGIMTTVVGFGAVLGVTVTAALFRELEDRKLDLALKHAGLAHTDFLERELEGVLSHSDRSEEHTSELQSPQ